MTDTTQEIKDLQLKIWLSKLPGERLKQFILDNEALLLSFIEAKIRVNQQKVSIDVLSSFHLLETKL